MKRKEEAQGKEVFLTLIKTLINNLLINNVNYENSYFRSEYYTKYDLLKDTTKRAHLILKCIENNEHLLEEPDLLGDIINDLIDHQHTHPDHGVGCACIDKHVTALRGFILDNTTEEMAESTNWKVRENLRRIFSYLAK